MTDPRNRFVRPDEIEWEWGNLEALFASQAWGRLTAAEQTKCGELLDRLAGASRNRPGDHHPHTAENEQRVHDDGTYRVTYVARRIRHPLVKHVLLVTSFQGPNDDYPESLTAALV